MESFGSEWYKKVWSLDIKNQSWTEDTVNQTDFIIKTLKLEKGARILDLACGYGRHSLELARRGFEVVGADITPAYVEDANKTAAAEKLNARFILSDIRDVSFENEFDAVLNLADGAVGYLENDAENEKIFDVIAKALKPGGKSLIDIMSADYADRHYPLKLWDAGEKMLTLSCFEWDKNARVLLYGQRDIAYGEQLGKPEFDSGFPTRLYGAEEMKKLLAARGLGVFAFFSDYYGKAASADDLQLMICSEKRAD